MAFRILFLSAYFFLNPTMGETIVKNASDIKVREQSKTKRFDNQDGVNTIHRCTGTVPSNVSLSSVGLTPKDFAGGVDCLAYDFDGNGSLDFLVYGAMNKIRGQPGLVIFYDGNRVVRSQVIEAVEWVGPFLANDPVRSDYPTFKGKFGLIHYFSGDGAKVYFFDKGSGLFQKAKYIFPPPSGNEE